MKLLMVLALFLAASVQASELAGPYQVAFLYFAYRMEVAIKGVGKTELAPGCRTAGKACGVNDLVKHIQMKTATNTLFTGDLGVGDDPTANHYSPNVDNEKLLKSWPSGSAGSFVKVYDGVLKVIQDTRLAIQKAGGDPDNNSQMTKLKEAIVNILDARRADNSKAMVQFFNAELLKRTSITVKPISVTNSVTTYNQIDSAAALNALGKTAKANKVKFVTDFVKDYEAGKYEKTGAKGSTGHFKAIQHAAVMENDLKKDLPPPSCGT